MKDSAPYIRPAAGHSRVVYLTLLSVAVRIVSAGAMISE